MRTLGFIVLSIFISGLLIGQAVSAAASSISIPAFKQKVFDGRDLRLVRILERNAAYTRYYITYKSGDLKISGIMNIPSGNGPFPVIITAHGYIDPKVYTNGRGLKREQEYFARRGFAVLHPDYRNHNGSDRSPDESMNLHLGYTQDVINAVYAIKNSGFKFIDKDNIGLLGHSMGGLIALNMMVIKPGLVNAYVLFAPMSSDYRENFNRWILGRREHKYGNRATADKIIQKYGSPEENPEFWDNISPKNFVDDIIDPVQLHHGSSDKSVPVEWSIKLQNNFKAHGKTIRAYYFNGEKHEFINQWPIVMKRAEEFFKRHLE